MKVCIGGTFNLLHKGHKLLIKKAFEVAGKNGSVLIGVTSGKLIVITIGTDQPGLGQEAMIHPIGSVQPGRTTGPILLPEAAGSQGSIIRSK